MRGDSPARKAGGAFAAALPGALVPELLWAHYMPALSVDGEQNKGPAFRARYPSGQVKLRSSLPEPFRAAPRSLGPSVHGMDRRYQGELLIRSSWHGRLRYLPQHHGYIRSRCWAAFFQNAVRADRRVCKFTTQLLVFGRPPYSAQVSGIELFRRKPVLCFFQ